MKVFSEKGIRNFTSPHTSTVELKQELTIQKTNSVAIIFLKFKT